LAEDKVDSEAAQNGGEEAADDAPKRTFGILAARFLQKGKSSPGSITGEFQALAAPEQKATEIPEPKNRVPVEYDDDDEIGESSAYGMEVPLTESLYADIGLDDMVTFSDADLGTSPLSDYAEQIKDDPVFDLSASEPVEGTPDIVYEIDSGETPGITIGTGISGLESAEAPSSDDEPEHQEEQIQVKQQPFDTKEAEAEEYQHAPEVVEATNATPTATEFSYEPETVEAQEDNSSLDSLEIVEDTEPLEIDLSMSGTETPAYDLSTLDSIGVKDAASTDVPDKTTLDQIAAEKEINDKIFVSNEAQSTPERKGLLGKFAFKKDSTVRPSIGQFVKKVPVAESKSFDATELDQIGVDKVAASAETSQTAPDVFDPIGSVLDQFADEPDSSDSYSEQSAEDQSGATKPFDPSELDQIGTAKPYDPGALDQIGTTKPYDASTLDQIGSASPPPAETEEKSTKGGLLGGKFGQKAKIFSAEKPKLGSLMPPSNEPGFDQKETGRFMVSATNEAVNVGEGLTQQPEESLSTQQDAGLSGQDEGLSGSFFNETKEEFVEEESIPVIPGDEVGRLITDADNAFRMKQYKAAEPIFASVLEKLDKAGDDNDPLLVYCLDKMGDNLFELKKYKETLQLYRRVLILHEKVSSPDRDMISTLYKIAKTSEALNLTGEADSMYKRAFRLGQQSLVPGDPLLAKVLEGYGTMLMRSEGAEPPSAEKPKSDEASGRHSALSADEIKILNELNVKAEAEARAAAESGTPIILSGNSLEDTSTRESKASRAPLRESDGRAEKLRASGTGQGGSVGAVSVWLRLGGFLVLVIGLIVLVLNLRTDYSKPFADTQGQYDGKVYKSLDGISTLTFVNEKAASKDSFGKHIKYDYKIWNGTPADDLEVLSAKVDGSNFVYEVPQGIKDADGFVYFDLHAPENMISAKMSDLGRKAQAYYKAKGKYPDGKELEKLVKSLPYKNPFGGDPDSITARGITWPIHLDGKQIFIKSEFDIGLEDGDGWAGEAGGKAGQISAASSNQKQPDASVFYVHGRDRHGSFLRRADGKVLLLIYKNGIDMTPSAADLKNEKSSEKPLPLRVTKVTNPVSTMTVLATYLPIVACLIASLLFLILFIQRKDKASQGYSIEPFGLIWAPLMVILTGCTKLATAPYSSYFQIASIVVFVGGLAWLGFQAQKSKPKTKKKPPVEASTM
jgi:tetratricopeptide (TPR) repeat protein